MEFHGLGRRVVVADFNGGAVLLRETERRTGVLSRFVAQLNDHRDAAAIEHTVEELINQRVMGIAMGYGDRNHHDHLRADQLLTLAAGNGDLSGKDRQRERDEGKPLTSSSTVNRLELTPWNTDENTRYKKIIAKPGTGSGILRPRDIAASIWRQRARANVDYLPSA